MNIQIKKIATRSKKLSKPLFVFIAAALALPVLANVNAIDYPAMPANATGTSLTLPGTGTEPLVSLEQCQQLAEPGEECDDDYSLFYVGTWSMRDGTELTLNYTPQGGNPTTVPLTMGSDGVARSGSGSPFTGTSSPSPGLLELGYPTFYARGGAAEVESLDTELGVKVDFALGVDLPLVKIGGTYSGYVAEVGGSLEFGEEGQRLFWGLNTIDADNDGSDTFSAADLGLTESYGYLYHQANPTNDSTGIGIDFLDFSVNYASSYKSRGVNLALGWDEVNELECTWTPTVGIRLSNSEYRLDSELRFQTEGVYSEPYNISSGAWQEIDEKLFGVGFGVAGHSPRGHYPFELSYRAMIYGDWIDHELRSEQLNICELCSSPEDSYLVHTSSENDEWGLGATLEVNLYYPITDRATIGAFGALGYNGNAPEMLNPVTESDIDDGPRLGTKTATNYQFGLTFGYKL